jgi:hypothetical protein
MKTKSCDCYVEDLADYATDSISLSAEAAAHLRQCAVCQEKVAELKAVVATQMEAAANLPEPKRRISRGPLERALDDSVEPQRPPTIRLRPILVGAVGLIAAAAVIFVFREPRELVRNGTIPTADPPAPQVGTEPAAPTMLALRNEVERGREQILARIPISGGMQHYRVRDVESELKN